MRGKTDVFCKKGFLFERICGIMKSEKIQMLEMIIDKSKELGIDKLLLTCDIDNVGSNKTVVGCGGILAGGNPFSYRGEPFYKYWINV